MYKNQRWTSYPQPRRMCPLGNAVRDRDRCQWYELCLPLFVLEARLFFSLVLFPPVFSPFNMCMIYGKENCVLVCCNEEDRFFCSFARQRTIGDNERLVLRVMRCVRKFDQVPRAAILGQGIVLFNRGKQANSTKICIEI